MKSLSISVYFCDPSLLIDEQCCLLNVVMALQLFGIIYLFYYKVFVTWPALPIITVTQFLKSILYYQVVGSPDSPSCSKRPVKNAPPKAIIRGLRRRCVCCGPCTGRMSPFFVTFHIIILFIVVISADLSII